MWRKFNIHDKNCQKLGIERNFNNLIKGICKKNLHLTSHPIVKVSAFSLTLSNKVKLSTLTTPIQYCTRSPSQCNMVRKRNWSISKL